MPERGCVVPKVPAAAPDSEAQQAAVMAVADRDCFNWGYDPYHYSAPEGSFATDAVNGDVRVRELRAMVMALHAAGLRVGMDVVYNHTTASGQHPHSVLDRIVPGYYQRLDVLGRVERSTCCDNTATEHRMMGKLLVDSVVLWAREYKIASFRFDLMGHQPRAVMETLQARLKRELGRDVQLLGEGWNFGEVADGKRFVQASQLSLNGTANQITALGPVVTSGSVDLIDLLSLSVQSPIAMTGAGQWLSLQSGGTLSVAANDLSGLSTSLLLAA